MDIDLSGLKSFEGLNDEAPPDAKLQEIQIDLIEEGPNIGRRHYNQKKLEELAETIKGRGVKSPISVHTHPEKDGCFIVNYGHRRLRASIIAGNETIAAIIDEDFDVLDQAVENIQRENLDAVGIATIVQYAQNQGKSKTEIAHRLGKTNSYVSDHVLFFELADDIRALYDTELCTSMRILAMLQRAYKKWPDEVIRYCREGSDFTASAVSRLSDHLKEESSVKKSPSSPTPVGEEERAEELPEELDGKGKGASSGEEWPGEPPSPFEDGLKGGISEVEVEESDDLNAPTAPAITGPGTHDEQREIDGLDSTLADSASNSTVPVVQVMVDGREGELKLCPSENDKIWVALYGSDEPELVPAGLVVIQRVG